MGSFCSRDNSPGRDRPGYSNIKSHGSNASPRGGLDRYARIGDEYETLEEVRWIGGAPFLFF
jgi:hypothetical protein